MQIKILVRAELFISFKQKYLLLSKYSLISSINIQQLESQKVTSVSSERDNITTITTFSALSTQAKIWFDDQIIGNVNSKSSVNHWSSEEKASFLISLLKVTTLDIIQKTLNETLKYNGRFRNSSRSSTYTTAL